MRISMMYPKSVFAAIVLVCGSFVPNVSAQPGGGPGPNPTPVAAPDDKSIENLPAPTSTQVNCWVSRSNSEAIAVSVYMDSTQQLVGKLRRYNKGIEDFREKDTQIKLPDSTILPAEKIVPFKLERLSGSKFPDVFNMMYTPPTGNPIQIGHMSFIRGNKTRFASSVVIRLNHARVAGVSDPCDEPPNDDIGEEEAINRAPTATFGVNAPGASLSFIEVISQPN